MPGSRSHAPAVSRPLRNLSEMQRDADERRDAVFLLFLEQSPLARSMDD